MSKIMLAAAIALAVLTAPVAHVAPDAAAQSQPATSADAKKKTAKPPTPGQIAARERQSKCAAEWKVAKADGKIDKAMTWPKYWSACNKRLKSAG